VTALSPEENKAIDDSYLKTVVDETLSIVQKGPKAEEEHYYFLQFVRSGRRWNKFGTHPLLKKIFPAVTFYRVYSSATSPETPSLEAEANGKFYDLPAGFNRLLLDNGLEVNNKSIIKLAKAFVIIAVEGKEITFLEGKSIKEVRNIGKRENVTYTAQLKVKVSEEVSNWHIPLDIYEKSQFGGATLTDKDNKVIKIYQLLVIEANQK
jgi:hypothetical protein